MLSQMLISWLASEAQVGFFDFASKTLKWSPLLDPIKFLGPETDSPGSDPEIQHLHPMNSKRLSSVPPTNCVWFLISASVIPSGVSFPQP